MKKFYLLTTLFLSFVCFSHAQKDPAAKAVLNKVSNHIKSSRGTTANFVYYTKDRNGRSKGSARGNIAIKGNQYHISQNGTEIYCDGTHTWNYNKAEKEVVVSTASDKSVNPASILSGFNTSEFNYKLLSSAGSTYRILLTPTDKRKNFKSVSLYVNKSQNTISRALVVDKAGNTTSFTLSNTKTNVNLPASLFVFNPKQHPGVEVID